MSDPNPFKQFSGAPPYGPEAVHQQRYQPLTVDDFQEYPPYIKPIAPQLASPGQAPFPSYTVQNSSPVPCSSGYFSPTSSEMSGVSSTQPPINRFPLNPNAEPFRPSYPSYQQNVPPYADAPMYDGGYCPPNAYDYQGLGQQPLHQFTPYMGTANTADNGPLDMSELAYNAMYDTGPAAGQQFTLSPDLCERVMYSVNAALIQEVQVGLEQLIYEPDEFETWSNAIRDRLVDKSITGEALSIAAEIILQMATLTKSVQYNFSRLCVFLCKEVQDFRQKSLLPQLRLYHETKRPLMSPEQLQNLLLFFAELFDKLELENGARLNVLAQAVYEQIKGLSDVQLVNDACIKTVIQVLKLTGRHLESIDGGTSKVDELLTSLNAFATAHPALSESVKHQIKALITLRENNWGMKNQEQLKPNSDLTPSSSSSNFIIGPDGQPLSDEERAFLEDNFGKLENNDSTLDENDVSDEYEEFLCKVEMESALSKNVEKVEADLRRMEIKEAEQKTDGTKSEKDESK